MADGPMSDAECIQAAYEDAVQATFKSLVANLVSQGDDVALAEFSGGMQLVQKAKALALAIIGNQPPASPAPTTTAPKPPRKPAAK
jgi:hypothetical protein